MRIRIYYACRRSELLAWAADKSDVVNEYGFLKQHGITCDLVPLQDAELRSLVESDQLIRDREGFDGYVLLLEQGLEVVVNRNVRIVALTCIFDAIHGPITSPQNVVTRDVVRAVRIFRSIKNTVQSDLGIWRLPIKNFISHNFQGFVGHMVNGIQLSRAGDQLLNEVQAHLQLMRRSLIRPRRQSNYPTKYCVDDRTKFFELGHEVHARIDTAHPHGSLCVALNSFRFGIKLSEEHHYNVSTGEGDRTTISGAFTGCHGEDRVVREGERRTHLNMFSNDFF